MTERDLSKKGEDAAARFRQALDRTEDEIVDVKTEASVSISPRTRPGMKKSMHSPGKNNDGGSFVKGFNEGQQHERHLERVRQAQNSLERDIEAFMRDKQHKEHVEKMQGYENVV